MGLFRKGKTLIIAKFHRTDLVICSHSREGKTLSYSQINTVSGRLLPLTEIFLVILVLVYILVYVIACACFLRLIDFCFCMCEVSSFVLIHFKLTIPLSSTRVIEKKKSCSNEISTKNLKDKQRGGK